MARFNKVMVSVITVLLVSCLASFAQASICNRTVQYWSSKLDQCVNCSECPEGKIVIAPCEIFKDTVCGHFNKIYQTEGHRYRHKHNQHSKRNHNRNERIVKAGNSEDIKMAKYQSNQEAPFDGTETLVWDLQALVLTIAISACILFFIAVTLYSLHQARQWKRLKESFEAVADVEELSAKLSLMAAASPTEKDILEGDVRQNGNEANYNNRCVYLDQLLNVRKDDKLGTKHKGNVYIEESI